MSRLLFQSGNPQPPPSFGDYDGFSGWRYGSDNPVGSKEFRAAMYLEGVVAEFPGDAPPRIDCAAYGTVMGYTPLRLFVRGVNIMGLLPQVAQYSQGTGPSYQPVVSVHGTEWAEIRYRAEFKLSTLPNVFARALAGSWAPYAWCEVRYRVHRTGEVDIQVSGSAIPNQRLYVDWARADVNTATGTATEYEMRDASPSTIAGFVRTIGWGCKPAPRASHVTWHGSARACYIEED